jgi:lysylphosphatidylglycerol synthetase-like protein (DUF2156 family)
LLGILGALLLSRKVFALPHELWREPLLAAWLTAIVMVLLLTVSLGIFSFKDVDYSAQLWTTFAIGSDVSRFLRSNAAALLLLAVLLWRRRSRVRSHSCPPEQQRLGSQGADHAVSAAPEPNNE